MELDEQQLRAAAADVDEALARARTMGPDERAPEWLVHVPPYDVDGVVVDRFEVSVEAASVDKLRVAFNPQRPDRSLDPGTYTRLTVDGCTWMTDTPAETRDLWMVDAAMSRFPWWDGGRRTTMLVAGLGLGVVVNRAIRVHRMERIDVVERDARVVKAVGPHYEALAAEHDVDLNIDVADIHEWKAPRGMTWDVGWFDIWATIDDEDMPEVKRLRDRFRTRLGWSGAWAQEDRRASRRRIRSGRWAY